MVLTGNAMRDVGEAPFVQRIARVDGMSAKVLQ